MKPLGTSQWVLVDQERIDRFAACTGDHQWIHVDVERARREGPHGGTIAHGYLLLSLVAPMVMEVGAVPHGTKAAINYGLDKARFIAPVKAGSRVRGVLALASSEPKAGGTLAKVVCTLEVEGEDKPALVAEILCLLLE